MFLLAFSSCQQEPLQTDITLDDDYSALVDAIKNADKTLSEDLARLELALAGGLVDQNEALEQIRNMVASLSGTAAEKLAAVAAAVSSQTTSLETKLALVEAAFNNGFSDAGQQQALLQLAISSLEGTLEEKLAAIESAIKAQTSGLETKIGLVEAAVQAGFADYASAQELILSAIDSAGDTIEEKAAAILKAVEGQAADLGAKLALIETAFKEGFAEDASVQDMILGALQALKGNAEEKLGAILTAVSSKSSGLETKFGMIATAAEQGFINEKTAIEAMQTALLASLGTTNDDLADLKSKVLAKLQSLSGQLTTEELAKAFKDIETAIAGKAASTEALLKDILDAVNDMIQISLTYLGNPSEVITASRGEDFTVQFTVSPPNSTVTTENLRILTLSDDRFFLPALGPGDGADHFLIKSIEADQNVSGKYLVTIKCDCPVVMWEESRLALEVKLSGKTASSESFPVHMVPRITEGLNIWHYPKASFLMKELNGIKLPKDSLGAIYAALDKREFVHKDNTSNVRTFDASLLESADFIPESYMLHEETHTNGENNAYATIRTIFEKGQDYMRFFPDTVKSLVWRNYSCSIGHIRIIVTGKLLLTDKWHRKDSIDNFKLGWWNTTYYLDENLKSSINDIEESGDLKDITKLESLFEYCGIKNSEITVPHYRYSVDRSRFIYPSSYALSGKFVDNNWKFSYDYVDDEWNILLNVGTGGYKGGDVYSMQGIVTVSVYPSESQSAFKVQQQYVNYELKLTLNDPH